MSWIKIRTDLLDDSAVLRLSDILGTDDPTTVGLLVRFWAWIDRQTADGTGIAISRARLDKLVGRDGFTAGMIEVGWLLGEDGDFQVPNFERHNGNSAKARALETEAKRLRRSDKTKANLSDKCPTKEAAKVGLEKRREEKNSSYPSDTHSADAPEVDILGIVQLYPKRERQAESAEEVRRHIQAGVDPAAIIAGTRAIAAIIAQLPSGHLNAYVPSAATFFRHRRWEDDPETWKRQTTKANGSADGRLPQPVSLGGRPSVPTTVI